MASTTVIDSTSGASSCNKDDAHAISNVNIATSTADQPHPSPAAPQPILPSTTTIHTFIAKYGKERITLSDLQGSTTIGQIKEMIQQETRILPIRQKLVGLSAKIGGTKGVTDELPISELLIKSSNTTSNAVVHQFILMGTPEEQIFIDPYLRDDLPEIMDDFDFDFHAGSDEWIQHCANETNLKRFTVQTPIHIMNEPRPNKPLLVLDLDHTLLDFSSKSLLQQQSSSNSTDVNTAGAAPYAGGDHLAAQMKRPYMDEFLSRCYHHYDMVIWSQTSWRWLETKLIELNMITHPGYKFCFVLDKTSMFTVVSTKRDGTKVKHHVKPLQIIWSKFPDRWGTHNTVHIDDLSRNFALNLDNGLQCTAYHRKKKKSSSASSSSITPSNHGHHDRELVGLSQYLIQLIESGMTFHQVDFTQWTDVVTGKTIIATKKKPKK